MLLACSGLFSWVEKNATVVTPSRLLAGVAYQQFITRKLSQGQESWQRPRILSLGAWLTSCWQEARYACPDTSSLLSAAQEHMLWKRVIAKETPDLFDLDAIAAMARRSAKVLAEWEMPVESGHWNDGSDALQFQRWMKLFRHTCREKGWITLADVWRLLPGWISQEACARNETAVVFLNDGVNSPALTRLIDTLGSRAELHTWDRKGPAAISPAKSFEDLQQQFDFAARWARETFEKGRSQSVGVFIPGLSAHRSSVERSFTSVFYPGACRALIDERARQLLSAPKVFNINAAGSLASEPLVSGALLLLQLAHPRIAMSDAGAILRSPFVAGARTEASLRSLADLAIRERRELDITLQDIASFSNGSPLLARIWLDIRSVVERRSSSATFAGWSRFIGDLLASAGWPGDEELTSREQEVVEAWKDALSQLSALSLVAEPVPFEVALEELRRILQAPFEQESLASPVQILDASDGPGLHFETALLVGISEESWPPPSIRSPLLPLKMQREHHIPGSSPQTARSTREEATAFLFSTAPDLTVTYSGRLSPLAEPYLAPDSEAGKIWSGKTAWESFKPALLEERNDGQAPPFEAHANARGGASIIKAQSLCPFRAFAEFRLQGRSPEEGCLGLDARERGGNLHKALEFVWQKLRTRDNLRATPDAQLEKLVESAIHEAVGIGTASSFGRIVGRVEAERLKALILEWLGIEREREQMFTVETVEQEQYLDLGGLRLRLRLDRIDRLANGQLLLIDYKSGEQKRKKLETSRPEEPQLLVYAAGLGSAVDGVLFAQLKPRDVRPVGFTREKHFKSKTVDVEGRNWDAFIQASTEHVERLAEEFKSGNASLDPLKGACDYCAQKPLCRITENRAGEESDD